MEFRRHCSARRAHSLLFSSLALLFGMLSAGNAQVKVNLTISAAASLKEALTETETAYKQSHANVDLSNNFGSSGTLAKQINQGAPVDVFHRPPQSRWTIWKRRG